MRSDRQNTHTTYGKLPQQAVDVDHLLEQILLLLARALLVAVRGGGQAVPLLLLLLCGGARVGPSVGSVRQRCAHSVVVLEPQARARVHRPESGERNGNRNAR